jgi:hypothetical protein
MPAAAIAGDVPVATIRLSKEVQDKIKKTAGAGELAQVNASIEAANHNARNRGLAANFDARMAQAKDKINSMARAIPTHALTSAGGAVLGFAIGWFGYNKLRTYFGVESYAPDAIVLMGGALVGFSAMLVKDRKGPGSAAPERFGLIGAGVGLAAAGAAQTYYAWFAA